MTAFPSAVDEYDEQQERGAAHGWVAANELDRHGNRKARTVEVGVWHTPSIGYTVDVELISRYVRDGRYSGRSGEIHYGDGSPTRMVLARVPAKRFSRKKAAELLEAAVALVQSGKHDRERHVREWGEAWLRGEVNR